MNRQKRWHERNPWCNYLRNARKRCNYRKHQMWIRYGGRGITCLLTLADVKALWFRDNAASMVKPSLDRVDENGNYEFSNCRFIELEENISRAHKGKKAPKTASSLRREFANSY